MDPVVVNATRKVTAILAGLAMMFLMLTGAQPASAATIGLTVSDEPFHSGNARALDGQTFPSGVPEYIFVNQLTVGPIVGVDFFIDGSLFSTDRGVPFDFAGTGLCIGLCKVPPGLPFDTSQLSEGPHIISATAHFSDGSTQTERATVTIKRFGPQFASNGEACTITGTNGNDVLNGTPNHDVICGLYGDDKINGLAGDDTIDGGGGNDTIDAGSGNDKVFAGYDNDVVHGGDNDDLVSGGPGVDQLYGDNGNDLILGGFDNDFEYGGAGNDVLDGAAGADQMFGGEGSDALSGGRDNDTLFGEGGADLLVGGTGNDTLNGGADFDELQGGPDTDSCNGGPESNIVIECE